MRIRTTLLLATLLLNCLLLAARPPVQQADRGAVHRHCLWSPQLADTVIIDVWTPDGYAADGPAYPAIYAHDGQNLYDATTTWNRQSWELDSAVGRLVVSDSLAAPVIVGIHSRMESRLGDLAPQKALEAIPDSLLRDFTRMSDRPLRGDAYAAFIANTLRPFINQTYNVRTDVASTTLLGSSMGGLISLYTMCEYPEVFGNALCLSTHWVGLLDSPADFFPQAIYAYLDKKLPSPATHRVYLDRGTETLDALYADWQPRFVELLESHGYVPGKSLMTLLAHGAAHEEDSWKRRVATPLLFILGK